MRFSACSLVLVVTFMLLHESVVVSGTPKWAGAADWCRSELFCGLSKPNGAIISEEEFDDFVNKHLSVYFPDGFTIFNTTGHWMGSTGCIHEDSRLVLILHNCTEESVAAVKNVSEYYAKTFGQDAVLYTVQRETKVCTEEGCFSQEKWTSAAVGIVVLSCVCGLLFAGLVVAIVLPIVRH